MLKTPEGAILRLHEPESGECRFRSLSYKVDQLDAKVEKYHHETKSDLASLRAVVGAQSHTLADHEERLKALEGE